MQHKIGAHKKRTQTAKELKAIRLQNIKTLGLELRAAGNTHRETHEKVKEAGYKINHEVLFNLLKDWFLNKEKQFKIYSFLKITKGFNLNDNKIEIYEYKELELFGTDVESREKHGSSIAAEELLDMYDIEYYEIEKAEFDKKDHLSLKVKISMQILKK